MAVAPKLTIAPEAEGEDAGVCGPVELEHLRKVPIFENLSQSAATKLCSLLVLREYQAPTRLFEAGESGDAMYFIESGGVRISVKDADGHEVTLSELHEGDFFGEMAMIDGHERSASATVIENSRLAVLTRSAFLSFITGDQQVMLAMLVAMAGRLRRTDNLLRHRVSRNANAEEEAQMSAADRAADKLAEFGGSWKFIGFAIGLLIAWIILNTILLTRVPFDPFPFTFLNLLLGVIAALQAPIIMMSQNRQTQKDRIRADLDYEVNLKNELLLTEIRSLLHEQTRRERDAAATRFERD